MGDRDYDDRSSDDPIGLPWFIGLFAAGALVSMGLGAVLIDVVLRLVS